MTDAPPLRVEAVLEAAPLDPAHAEPLETEKRTCDRCAERGRLHEARSKGTWIDPATGEQQFATVEQIRDSLAALEHAAANNRPYGAKFKVRGQWLCPRCDADKEDGLELTGRTRADRRSARRKGPRTAPARWKKKR